MEQSEKGSLVPLIVIVAIAQVTASYQTFQATSENSVKALRNE